MNTIEFSNIDKLKVKRYSFKDLEITNRFYLGEVRMATVVSMAFDLHFVKEFSIFASKFDRISMFGIKFDSSKEFNVLGMTYFGTLAAHAIKVESVSDIQVFEAVSFNFHLVNVAKLNCIHLLFHCSNTFIKLWVNYQTMAVSNGDILDVLHVVENS